MVKTVNVTLWEIYRNIFEKGNSNEGSITVQGHVGECCSVSREGGFSCTEASPWKDVFPGALPCARSGQRLPPGGPRTHSLCVSACPPVGAPRC